MPRAPLSEACGIGAGIKYGLAIWICAGLIAALLAGGIKIGHDESKRIVASHSENYVAFRSIADAR